MIHAMLWTLALAFWIWVGASVLYALGGLASCISEHQRAKPRHVPTARESVSRILFGVLVLACVLSATLP